MSTYSGTRLNGRFRLDARIGEGTFAEIFRATDSLTGTVVAIKRLRPEHHDNRQAIALFQQEGEIGSSLAHPNIVRVLSYGEAADTSFIVMELVSGISLRRWMRRSVPLSINESVHLTRAILRGLDAVHDAGYVHRDIKPQNILLEADGTPKITDFGITLRTGGIRASDDGTTLGTAAYIAPEQAAGWEIGPRADLYATGVVLYEMLTGQVPFPGDDPLDVMYRHMYEIPRDPRELNDAISPALAAVVLRALAKVPEERFASAREMHDALAMVQFEEISSVAATAPRRPALRRRSVRAERGSVRTSFVGALMLAVLALVVVLALVSSGVGADDSDQHALQPTQPANIVVDQPATTTPDTRQVAPIVQQPRVTPSPTTTAPTPVNNAAATVTPSATTTPAPTASATSTPEPTATPKPTETPQPQVAQAPVQTDSSSSNKKKKKSNADDKRDTGAQQTKKPKNDNAAANPQQNNDEHTGDTAPPVADSSGSDASNERSNWGFGATQNVTNAPDSDEPPIIVDPNSSTSRGHLPATP